MTEDLETTVKRLTRVGSCFSPSLSPDGSRLAFLSSLTGRPQVWTVDTAGGYPSSSPRSTTRHCVEWSPDGGWLAFSVAPGGGMNEQVYLVRPDGTGLKRLTDGGKENNWLGPWTHDGAVLAIASNRRGPTRWTPISTTSAAGTSRLVPRTAASDGFDDVARRQLRAPEPPRQSRRQQSLSRRPRERQRDTC